MFAYIRQQNAAIGRRGQWGNAHSIVRCRVSGHPLAGCRGGGGRAALGGFRKELGRMFVPAVCYILQNSIFVGMRYGGK